MLIYQRPLIYQRWAQRSAASSISVIVFQFLKDSAILHIKAKKSRNHIFKTIIQIVLQKNNNSAVRTDFQGLPTVSLTVY